MLKTMKRAIRRNNLNKRKKRIYIKYFRHWGFERDDILQMNFFIGIRAKTRTLCSCYMCGNPRKYYKEKSYQEKKQDEIERINRKIQ